VKNRRILSLLEHAHEPGFFGRAVAVNFRLIQLAIPFFLTATLLSAEPSPSQTAAERIATRSFPSVFQAWNPADNLKGEDKWTTLARLVQLAR